MLCGQTCAKQAFEWHISPKFSAHLQPKMVSADTWVAQGASDKGFSHLQRFPVQTSCKWASIPNFKKIYCNCYQFNRILVKVNMTISVFFLEARRISHSPQLSHCPMWPLFRRPSLQEKYWKQVWQNNLVSTLIKPL